MSNYAKSDPPDDVDPRFYADYEVVNGTGGVLLWVHDDHCVVAGGSEECCAGAADGRQVVGCQYVTMSYRDMDRLGVYLLETAARARWAKVREDASGG